MNILALETSTICCSAAVLRDGSVLAEAEWESTTSDHQHLFRILPNLSATAAVTLADIDCFAADSGPGRFTGLRAAMAAALSMALPGNRPVIGVDSGSAIAWQVWRRGAAGPVAVVGDARRNRLWITRFEDGAAGPRVLTPYTSIPVNEASGILVPGDKLVSPDWTSTADVLRDIAERSGAIVIPEPLRPVARTIGQLASLRLAAGVCAPPAIVYIHPPV
jgi:tRNA threonylcarbamoyladenosine biosynthesis protein TsaB